MVEDGRFCRYVQILEIGKPSFFSASNKALLPTPVLSVSQEQQQPQNKRTSPVVFARNVVSSRLPQCFLTPLQIFFACSDVEDESEFNFVYEQSPAPVRATTPPHTTDKLITPPSHREFEAHDRVRVHSGGDAFTTSAAAAAVLHSRQMYVC